MNREISQRITIISFFAMISVICWHCYCGSEVEKYILPLFFYWSVPWFFLVSGFLLAYSMEHRGIVELIKSKCTSLLIPYLLWSLVGAWIIGFSNCGSVLDVFGIVTERIFPMGNQSLWYLRSVIVFSAGGILIYTAFYLFARIRIIATSITLCTFMIALNSFLLQISTGSSPVYFCIGLTMWSFRDCLVMRKKRISYVVFVLAAILFGLCKIVYFAKGYSSAVPGGTFLTNLATCLFVVGIWIGVGLLSKGMIEKVICLKFLYVQAVVYFMHYPLLRKVIDTVHWKENIAFVFYCCIAPVLFVGCAMLIKVMMPRFYRIASGGRV